MKIAVIGVGNVGGILGRRWAELGHEVAFGVRNTNDARAQAAVKSLGGAIGTVAEAVAQSEVVVLAVPWKAALDAIASAGDLKGKILLDCTNPLAPDLSGLEIGHTTSGGEQVAQAASGAKVVKIFNTTGAGNMANPHYGGTKLTMLYAGDDDGANQVAAKLAGDIGFEPVLAGPLSSSRLLEPLALIWISMAFQQRLGMDFALNLVRRPGK